MYLFKDVLLIPSAEDLLLLWFRLSITFQQHLECLPSLPLRLQSSIALHPEDVAVASLPKLEHLSLDYTRSRVLHTFVELIAFVIVCNHLSDYELRRCQIRWYGVE